MDSDKLLQECYDELRRISNITSNTCKKNYIKNTLKIIDEISNLQIKIIEETEFRIDTSKIRRGD